MHETNDVRLPGPLRPSGAAAGIASACLIICLSIIATYQRNLTWENPLVLLNDTVGKSPYKARVHYNFGTRLGSSGRADEAIAHLKTAIRLRPNSEEYNNLATVYESQRMFEPAIETYHQALRLDPRNAEAYYNLGRTYLVSEISTGAAIEMFSRAIALRSDYADARVNLAAAYLRAGRFEDAVHLLENFFTEQPDRPDALFNLSVAYCCLGNDRAARAGLNRLRALDSPYAGQLQALIERAKRSANRARPSGCLH